MARAARWDALPGERHPGAIVTELTRRRRKHRTAKDIVAEVTGVRTCIALAAGNRCVRGRYHPPTLQHARRQTSGRDANGCALRRMQRAGTAACGCARQYVNAASRWLLLSCVVSARLHGVVAVLQTCNDSVVSQAGHHVEHADSWRCVKCTAYRRMQRACAARTARRCACRAVLASAVVQPVVQSFL
ncbi:hypothetical protein XBLMG947_1049 [Xanthomonas bromi]|uniref:Uncharacterized protein n=1 Tax=Xanthomonas bromi TaxID=56449 RepID=A0A1C3NIP6_9XANT|nr:hypothetical protein XBLMG947_1049 [Xanthomonas bromi]